MTGKPGGNDTSAKTRKRVSRPERYRKKREADPPALAYLAEKYRRSPEFGDLSVNSRRVYDLYLFRLVEGLAWIRLSEISDRASLRDFYDYRDRLAQQQIRIVTNRLGVTRPGQRVGGAYAANMAMSVLSALLGWAVERGEIDVNLARHVKPLGKRNTRARLILSAEDEARILANATPDFRRLILGALYTFLRMGDLIQLGQAHQRLDGWLHIIPQKTAPLGIEVSIPINAFGPLQELLAPGLTAGQFFRNRSIPWTKIAARAHWNRSLPPDLAHLHFHDLRGTAIQRAYEAGCTDAEVGTIAGKRFGAGTLGAYASASRSLALSAYAKLQQAYDRGVVVALPAVPEKNSA